MYLNATADGLAISCGVEDVTNSLSFGEGMVGDLNILVIVGVSHGDQEFSSWESVEVLCWVSLNPLFVPDSRLFALSVDLSDDLIKVTACVHWLPEWLTVLRIVTSCEVLFGTVVNEWNTTSSQCENGGCFKLSVLTSVVMKEACVVVIVNENSKGVNVFELWSFWVITWFNLVHSCTITENIGDSVVHGIIEETGDVILVGANVSRVAIENLAHLENTSRSTKLTPEILGNFRDSVDTDTVEIISWN